jgi:hypothetical protein
MDDDLKDGGNPGNPYPSTEDIYRGYIHGLGRIPSSIIPTSRDPLG